MKDDDSAVSLRQAVLSAAGGYPAYGGHFSRRFKNLDGGSKLSEIGRPRVVRVLSHRACRQYAALNRTVI